MAIGIIIQAISGSMNIPTTPIIRFKIPTRINPAERNESDSLNHILFILL
jgi:hypothetical protein